MTDVFNAKSNELTSPASNCFLVTPHDTNELAQVSRAVWVGGAGALNVILAGDTSAVLISGIAAGTLLPIRARIIKSTSTTATLIVALY